jgi:hypothetical protein
MACEGVRLFADRARDARPAFEVDAAHAGSTASRWPSSWPPPASGPSRPRGSSRGSPTGSGSLPAAPAPPWPASRRCRPRWSGVTTC